MSEWILIYFLTRYDVGGTATQSFTNRASCEIAGDMLVEMKKTKALHSAIYTCVPKDIHSTQ